MGADSVREPTQRFTTRYTGKRMDERIGASAANVKSVLVQIGGEVSQQERQSCQKNRGPWAHCVRFHDLNRTLTAVTCVEH
jgi:hypothetical protein